MPPRADILYLAAGLGTGGTEIHLTRLLPAVRDAGLSVAIWNAGEGGAAAESLEASGVAVETVAAPTTLRRPDRLAAWASRLARERPGLVHSYLYGRHWLDAVACRLAGVRYIGSRRNLAHWRRGPVLARERWRDRLSDAIVANSRAVAEVAEREGADPRRLVVIPNGVPLPAWPGDAGAREALRRQARAALGLEAEARVIGSVASLKPIKDPMTLLRAFAARRGARPGDHLVLVGEGPLADDLRTEAARLGVGDGLVLAGARTEPAPLLAAFDIFALASRAEGCSNALAEAMAAGLPVVATRVGGNVEAVEDGSSGLLVPAGDTQRLAAALDQLLQQPGLAAGMGQAARRQAASGFSMERMVAAHLDLYRGLLARPRGGQHAA